MKTQASRPPFIALGMIRPSSSLSGGSMRASRVNSSSLGIAEPVVRLARRLGGLGIELELAHNRRRERPAARDSASAMPALSSIGLVFSACSLAAFFWPESKLAGGVVLALVVFVLGDVACAVEHAWRACGWRRRIPPWPCARPRSRRRRSPAAASRRPRWPRVSRLLQLFDQGAARLVVFGVGRGVARKSVLLRPSPRHRPARRPGGGSRAARPVRARGSPARMAPRRRAGARARVRRADRSQAGGRGAHNDSLRSEQSRRTWSSTSAIFCMPLIAESTAGSSGAR